VEYGVTEMNPMRFTLIRDKCRSLVSKGAENSGDM
jgi:hypothetical protein